MEHTLNITNHLRIRKSSLSNPPLDCRDPSTERQHAAKTFQKVFLLPTRQT